ncbi:Cu-Zn family superoxide dismutase [Salsuginibacillus halophilus]|uniref:Superoxide dismutase [Cu-Zn] n=1 Tax=Salsuginibacillus halophilus TaxID=517424 RepID=A0A2P8HXC6_9BACI|nr:superoxide dismutase family protein [Salsuginibacillus halophilus]PSL50876.1 Cu-Zn family superoxide dismutase [Salsuginibacillus halophilus]
MQFRWKAVGMCLLITLAACQPRAEEPLDHELQPVQSAADSSARAEMTLASGEDAGTVSFLRNKEGLTVVTGHLHDVTPGFHGFHIHENAICEPEAPDGPFTSAGGHYNPENTDHPAHSGDLVPVYAVSDGTAQFSFVTDQFSPEELIDAETALILHEQPDNFANIPDRYVSQNTGEAGPDEDTLATGDSGAREACGVIGAQNSSTE